MSKFGPLEASRGNGAHIWKSLGSLQLSGWAPDQTYLLFFFVRKMGTSLNNGPNPEFLILDGFTLEQTN